MSKLKNIGFFKNGYQPIVVLLMFLVGMLNSNPYFNFMGYNNLTKFLLFTFYVLIAFMFLITIFDYLYNKKKFSLTNSTFPYLVVLIFAIVLKYFVLFIQFPSSFLPGEVNSINLLTHISNLSLVIIIINNIYKVRYIKSAIWAFGIGASFSALIPFVFFPEMIGRRISLIDNFIFVGAFWNSAVISYMSVGWLLIALVTLEKSKLKRGMLIGIFTLLVLGSFAGLSRAALLSIVISVMVYLLLAKNLISYFKTFFLILLFLFIISIYFQDAIDNFEQRLDGGINLEEESRVIIWKDYLQNISDYFFLGEIEGNYRKYSTTGHSPHSVLLNWFTQFGIFALIGYLALLYGLFKSIKVIREKHSKHIGAILYAWLFAYLSIALVNETGFDQLSVYGGIGILFSWANIVKKDNTRTSKKFHSSSILK